jgi:hypothetical protein
MFVIPTSWYVIRKTRPRLSSDKGRAVFARREIPAGTVIGDYLGKVIKTDSEDEVRDGLYAMWCNDKCDLLADPKVPGMHFLNSSCANNCDIFPYKGHMLVFATRRIFKGEEITINYGLVECGDDRIACELHACTCGARVCLGSMHVPEARNPEAWGDFVERHHGKYYRKLPAPYGTYAPPLPQYPARVGWYSVYNAFGTEEKPAAAFRDATLPTVADMSKRIRETGRQLKFPRLHVRVLGIRDGLVLTERV